ICCLGIPLIIGYNTVCAILRGMGDSKSPLAFVAIACVVNIVGDLLLSGLFSMGAAGVAIATVVAQGISFLVGLIYLMKKGIGVPFSRADIQFSAAMSGRILKQGIPLAIKSILVNLSFMLITAIINAMGVTASAAMGVGDKIVSFAFLPQTSFSNSISVIVAQNMGAKKPERAKQATLYGMATCIVWSVCFLALSQLFPSALPALFTRDLAVQEMCGQYLKAYSLDGVLVSIVFCLSSMFTGCGRSTFTMVQDLVTTFLVRVPVTYFVSRISGITLFEIGLAAPAASVLGIVICLVYLKMGKWKEGFLFNQ
ncbi:MAG: MATE family efflux transporter, partial [Roseburia sp.]|nr:MATE family efflux transporter [Roseburia sp.]